ncbi:hypothetical protein H4R21_003591, partial [Coemansia helicoidea]
HPPAADAPPDRSRPQDRAAPKVDISVLVAAPWCVLEMSAHSNGAADHPSPPPPRPPSPEKPIHVVLETEPPVRKPGRPRLDISTHFQDTGEMANHSHRLVWCIGCIKSGRPLYRKDRLPARGDLMQRHLQACKHVSDEVRAKFCPQRSSSASSAGEAKTRKTNIAK